MYKLTEAILNKIDERLADRKEDAFYILDLEDVKMKYQKWVEKMPRVKPFYAIKCNGDEQVVQFLMEWAQVLIVPRRLKLKKF